MFVSAFFQSLNTFRSLSRREQSLALRAWPMLLWTSILVHTPGLGGAGRLVRRAEAGRADTGDNLAAAESTARMVHATAQWVPGRPACLVQSLVLCRMLHRQGLHADLRIGVGKPGGTFGAHAWVDHRGVPLHEGAKLDRDFVPFDVNLSARR